MIIDFEVIDYGLRGVIEDTKVFRGAEVETDHFLIVSRVKIEKLQDDNVRNKYEKCVEMRLDVNKIGGLIIDERWKHIKVSHCEFARESGCERYEVGTKGRKNVIHNGMMKLKYWSHRRKKLGYI